MSGQLDKKTNHLTPTYLKARIFTMFDLQSLHISKIYTIGAYHASLLKLSKNLVGRLSHACGSMSGDALRLLKQCNNLLTLSTRVKELFFNGRKGMDDHSPKSSLELVTMTRIVFFKRFGAQEPHATQMSTTSLDALARISQNKTRKEIKETLEVSFQVASYYIPLNNNKTIP